MTQEAFGWAAMNQFSVLLPAHSTRVAAIRDFIHSMDADLAEGGNFNALAPHEASAWRRMKSAYGVRVARVRVIPFGETP